MSLRRVPFLRVLWRPQLFAGGERGLMLFVTGVAIILPVYGMNILSVVIGVGLWCLAIPCLRWVAKMDPQFTDVYRRQLKYQRFYPARSTPYRTL